MHPFEQYLISQGFRRYDERGNETAREGYSTTGNLRYTYKKDDLCISWGLNERGHPPTLIHPQPKISGYFDPAEWGVELPDGKVLVIHPIPDVIMHRVLDDHAPADVLKSITERLTLYKQ